MPTIPFIAIGGSAGSIEALHHILPQLPADLEAAVAIVLHRGSADGLTALLQRWTVLPVEEAGDGVRFEPAHVYVAPGNIHLTVGEGRFAARPGPRQNGVRPSIDALFGTVAHSIGPYAVGVLLSGVLDDGVAGLASIARFGGAAVAQDPQDALFGELPGRAVDFVEPLHRALSRDIGPLVVRLAAESPLRSKQASAVPIEEPAPYSCPACSATMVQDRSHDTILFRCRVGHLYAPDTLDAAQGESVENSLWAAIQALDDRADLSRRMARRFTASGMQARASRYERQAELATKHAVILKKTVEDFIATDDQTLPMTAG